MTYTIEQLNDKTVAELREMCSDLSITGMSKKRKDIIIDAILTTQRSNSKKTSSISKSNDTPPAQPVGNPNVVDSMSFELHSQLTKPGAKYGDKITTTIQVTCGASSAKFPVCGKSIGAVKVYLKEVMNIDTLADGVINGKKASEEYILREGDILEYLKPAGQKG